MSERDNPLPRIRRLLNAEARRIDCGDCSKPVYQFGKPSKAGDGNGGWIEVIPRKYDATGHLHEHGDAA